MIVRRGGASGLAARDRPTTSHRSGGNNNGIVACCRFFYVYFWWIIFGFVFIGNVVLLATNVEIFSATPPTTTILPPPKIGGPGSTLVRRKPIQSKTTLSSQRKVAEILNHHQQQQHQAKKIQSDRQRPNEDDGLITYDHTFSFCLLIKDDNSILKEWLAYHYHVLNLRYLIVAIDPSSQTSPQQILEEFTTVFNTNDPLKYEIWNDPDYMPDFFMKGQFDLVPRMIKVEDKNLTKWQEEGDDSASSNKMMSEQELQQEYIRINNHRYRQSKFLQHCSKRVQDLHKTWMTHIDTDEYIVLNPILRRSGSILTTKNNIQISSSNLPSTVLSKNSLWSLLETLYDQDPETINWPCLSMPRVLYGSVTDDGDVMTQHHHHHHLETLRWKYHTSYTNDTLNKQPKVVVDVSGFPIFNLTRKAFSIHRPSLKLCRPRNKIQVDDYANYPLSVNHYVGSYERYMARDDPRRTLKLYKQKAYVEDGGKDSDNQWIDTWYTSFVKEYGQDKVSIFFFGTTNLEDINTQTTTLKENDTTINVNNNNNNDVDNDEIVPPPKFGPEIPLDDDSFSACLLLKDDNDILNEWIAYHYHVLKLRTLVLATDPSSVTSPSAIINRWKNYMDIVPWTDKDYMPDFFLNGEYDQVPHLIGNRTNGTNSQYHQQSSNDNGEDSIIVDEATIKEDLQQVNNHRYRQATFFYSCIMHLKAQNKTWMTHIDTDEYMVMHPAVRRQDHWKKLKNVNMHIGPSSILKFLKLASKEFSKALSYPCVSMPRLLFGSKEDGDMNDLPRPFNATKFETLRWKYHSDYVNDIEWNGKPKVIMDLTGLPPKSNFLSPQQGVYSIHKPSLRMCRPFRDVLFNITHKFPITVNHYIGSWERYSSRSDVRRNSKTYTLKSSAAAGKDDNWIDGWVTSFIEEMGLEQAKLLLSAYTNDDAGGDISRLGGIGAGDLAAELDEIVPLERKNQIMKDGIPRSGFKSIVKPGGLEEQAVSKHMEFSACLLTKDDNDILDEWVAYHYQVLGLRYMIVAVDAKSVTSPTSLLDKWRAIGMTIEEWKDEMFMPDLYFQKAYHLQPRLVKIKKNKHKWLEGIDDPELKERYVHEIQDHRYRQIVFVSECAKRLREQNRTWMVHIDTDEYIVINPKLRKLERFNASIDIPPYVEGSIIPRLLSQMIRLRWDTLNYPCVSLPRLLYGSVEDHPSIHKQTIPQYFNASRFETIRWKFHAKFDDSDLNKQPKVMIDVSAIPDNDKMLTEGRVFSIHRPSQYLCRNQGQMNFSLTDFFPFSVNHYLGTFERFGARDDLRRNRKLYNQKANVQEGRDDEWIDGWLDSFIQDVGERKVHELLQKYLIE